MLRSLRTLFSYDLGRAFGRGDLMSHVTGYPARSRDSSCDRHTATATWSPPHGYRYTVTATRPPPHVPGHVPGHVSGHVPGHVMSHVPGCVGTFNHGNLPGPLALGHSRRPLALWHPRPLLPLWPMATLSSWPTPFVNHGRWRPSSLGGPRLLAASNLRRPLAHRAPLATINY